MSAEHSGARQRYRRPSSAGEEESEWPWMRGGGEHKDYRRRDELDREESDRREQERLADRQYKARRRASFDADKLAEKRQRRAERWKLHRPRVVKEWARAGRAVVALVFCVLLLLAWVNEGMTVPSIVSNAAARIETLGEELHDAI